MKNTFKTLMAVASLALLGAVSAQAQGQINFFTFNSGGVAGNLAFGRVSLPASLGGGLAGTPYVGQLYGGTAADSLSPIGALGNLNQGVINSGIVTVASIAPGSAYFYQLVVPGTAATLEGRSAVISTVLGGTRASDGAVFSVPQANAFTSFSLVAVPEPSVIALAIVGAGALILRRRKA